MSSRPFAPSRLFVRRFAVGALLFVGAVCSPSSALFAETPVCPLSDAFEFAQELSDEFDGAALDAEKWFDFNPAWRGRKPALFSRQNVAVADGTLRLTASLMKPEEVDVENKVRGYDKYWKAIVKSREKIAYGYFEARCQAMRANVCNAFWLYDPHSDRPDVKYVEGEFSEEIDVLEVFGKPSSPSAQNVVWGTLHRYATPYLESIVNKKKDKLANKGFKLKRRSTPPPTFIGTRSLGRRPKSVGSSTARKFSSAKTTSFIARCTSFSTAKLCSTGWASPTRPIFRRPSSSITFAFGV